MCLLVIAHYAHPHYPLILAANRDEFYDRPTQEAGFWSEHPDLLAGRDLRSGGTWLGMTRGGRLAAVTNYRDPSSVRNSAPSRGRLVTDFLVGNETPEAYLQTLSPGLAAYSGFNLVLSDGSDLWWASNRGGEARCLGAGIFAVCNHLLDTPWPKVIRAKRGFERILSEEVPSVDAMWETLADRGVPADTDLPDTGVGLTWERVLAPIFVASPSYGTRSSTLILMALDGEVRFLERTYDPEGGSPPKTQGFRFEVTVPPFLPHTRK